MYYFDSREKYSSIDFGRKLTIMAQAYMNENAFTDIVFLCIGTDCSTGDSLGPMVGYKLSKRRINGFTIYGTLSHPVHALNLSDTLLQINKHHRNALVIAIDASIGTSAHVGYVTLNDSPLKPGLGVKKTLPHVGHLSITGIVNVSGLLDSMVLQSTRLSTVMRLADCISGGLTFFELSYSRSNLVNRL